MFMHAYCHVRKMSSSNSNSDQIDAQANKRRKITSLMIISALLAAAAVMNIKSLIDFNITHAIMSG